MDTDLGYPTLCTGVVKGGGATVLTSDDTDALLVAKRFHRSVRSKVRPLERALNNYFKKYARRKVMELRRAGTLRLFSRGKVAKGSLPIRKALPREEEEAFVDLVLRYGDKVRDAEAKKIVKEDTLPLIWPKSFYTAKRKILGEAIRSMDAKIDAEVRNILSSSTAETVRPSASALEQRVSAVMVGPGGILGGGVARRTANTEIPSFKNFGKHVAYKKAGVKKLRWVSIIDDRTRPAQEKTPRASHIAMDKRETNVGTPFDMAVSGARMYYPGDPSGPPYEVINCRCTIMPLGAPKR